MRIGPVSSNYYSNRQQKNKVNQPNFSKKFTCTKVLCGAFTTLGTFSAMGGLAMISGGILLLPSLVYGTICGGIGAGIGYMIDKQPDIDEMENKKTDK